MNLTGLNLFGIAIAIAIPEGLGVTDCKFPLDSHDVNLVMGYRETPSLFGCSVDFLELSRIIMQEKNLTAPKNAADAKTLYITLIQEIEKL